MSNTPRLSESRSSSYSDENDLFTSITPAASSQISGGYWHSYSTSFPTPPRLHSYSHGRLPSYSHQLAAQRLNQALFA